MRVNDIEIEPGKVIYLKRDEQMACKMGSKAADYVMDLFGIDKRLVKDISFSFPLHGAAQVTIVRLLSAEEEEHAKRLMEPSEPDMRHRASSSTPAIDT